MGPPREQGRRQRGVGGIRGPWSQNEVFGNHPNRMRPAAADQVDRQGSDPMQSNGLTWI